MNIAMELDIWKGDWGLASIDLDCLRLVTYCKFAGAPVNLNIKNHTFQTPSGKLPVFRHYKRTLCSFEAVSSYLTAKNLSPDFGLTQKEKADVVAFTMFLKEFLYPALLYVWWVDERNRINLTRKWYAKTLPFPLSMFYPNQYHKAALESVEALYPNIESEQMLENEIYEKAMQCITAISHRLGSQEFMFGAHPSSIDATLYAYLAPLVKAPFPSAKLKTHVISHNNLLKYVTRISQRYFAAEMQAFEAQKLQETVNDSGAQTNNFPHKRRNQILAAGIAVMAMAGYAVNTGLLQIPSKWFSRYVEPPRTFRIPIRYQ
uniref:GST C-terminal domain-containing protein n=1 Tax=Graphocephala atropunctata TaxID=36148 RepID=A0A1B6KXI1_9HEMI